MTYSAGLGRTVKQPFPPHNLQAAYDVVASFLNWSVLVLVQKVFHTLLAFPRPLLVLFYCFWVHRAELHTVFKMEGVTWKYSVTYWYSLFSISFLITLNTVLAFWLVLSWCIHTWITKVSFVSYRSLFRIYPFILELRVLISMNSTQYSSTTAFHLSFGIPVAQSSWGYMQLVLPNLYKLTSFEDFSPCCF